MIMFLIIVVAKQQKFNFHSVSTDKPISDVWIGKIVKWPTREFQLPINLEYNELSNHITFSWEGLWINAYALGLTVPEKNSLL